MRSIVSPLLLVLVIGLIAVASMPPQQSLLAPSLAAAAFTQVFTAEQPGAKPYGIVVGQAIGVFSGFCGVLLAGAGHAPKFIGDHDLTWHRVVAIAVAVAITATLQEQFKARSPAGGTTAVVVAVGAETANLAGAIRLGVGILLVALLGEAARRVMLAVKGKPDKA